MGRFYFVVPFCFAPRGSRGRAEGMTVGTLLSDISITQS
jgi:hypothetical protein